MRKKLNPELREYLEKLERNAKQVIYDDNLDVEAFRADDRIYAAELMNNFPAYDTVVVEDVIVPFEDHQIPVRVFTPEGLPQPAPAYVYIHGGGFVIASLIEFGTLFRQMAAEIGCRLFLVDYRLAPENPYPIPLLDSYHALEWIYRNRDKFELDPGIFIIGGDSAGGNLSAAITQKLRAEGKSYITHQILVVPVLDLTNPDTESQREFYKGYMLDAEAMDWFRRQYAPDPELWQTPLVSPLLAEDFRNLPPAHIFTAECDPLRDEGYLYAQALERAGVEIRYTCYSGMVHPFFVLQRHSEGARQSSLDMFHEIRSFISY